ncbi:MAG: hypothetical protein HYT12_02070 [Candidatus Liptonbacteria bacterium]|nr:hypothetical protein [Candidatus Liptonbacteria bacterium]
MKILEPRIVFSSGMIAAGKSTTCRGLVREIANAFYLDRDDMIFPLLHVAPTVSKELPPFEEYVKNDNVFPDNARMVDTPFGEMIQIYPANHYHRRHSRDQVYLIQARLASRGLDLGKVPVLDCFLMRQIDDGSLGRFIEQPLFRGYLKYLIHFVVSPEACFERIKARKGDKEAEERSRGMFEIESFKKTLSEKHERIPRGLKDLKYLLMDTTDKSTEKCVSECLSYISGPSPYM